MSALENFPMVNQQTPITSDGKVSENANLDCVAASICAGVMYLKGVTAVNTTYNPDRFKDAAYGQGYQGGTDAPAYVAFCKSLGIDLFPITANPAQLVVLAHQYIAGGKPVVFTEPNPYGSNLYTHFCVFYAEDPGYLTCMDPFIAKPIRRTDQDWTQLLLNNRIWILQNMEEEDMPLPPIDLNNPTVASYFTAKDSGTWLCKQTGKIIYGENLKFYQNHGGTTLQGLEDLGLPRSNEIPIETLGSEYAHLAGKGITVKFYERGVTIFDPSHLYDDPPGSGPVYKAQLYNNGAGTDPRIKPLEAQITELEKQPAMPALYADMQSVKAIAEKY